MPHLAPAERLPDNERRRQQQDLRTTGRATPGSVCSLVACISQCVAHHTDVLCMMQDVPCTNASATSRRLSFSDATACACNESKLRFPDMKTRRPQEDRSNIAYYCILLAELAHSRQVRPPRQQALRMHAAQPSRPAGAPHLGEDRQGRF